MQSLGPDRFELVVVADSSQDVERTVATARLSCETRVLRWQRPHDFAGHSAGILRNRGAAAARGDVLVFLDSDVIIHPDCLIYHARAHERPENIAVAGAAHELSIENQPPVAVPLGFDEMLLRTVPDLRVAPGENALPASNPPWALWFTLNASLGRSTFEAAGGFSERGLRCHDLELGIRLTRIGATFVFLPEAAVIHLEHPRSLRAIADKIHGWMHIATEHPEVQAYAEDRIRLAARSLRRVASEVEARFVRLLAGLPGRRLECSWICPPGTSRGDVERRLAYCVHTLVEGPGGVRFQLRLEKQCWDYSVDLLSPEGIHSPRVSIVCPLYNARHTLARAFRSVLMQHTLDWELILVDDASRDSSARLATQYLCDPRVRLVSHRHNQGLSRALNSGLAIARAPILVQLDADDALELGALAGILEAFSVVPAPVAIYGDPWVETATGEPWTHEGKQLLHPEDHFEYREYQAPRAYQTAALRAIGGWLTNDAFEGRVYDDRLVLARLADIGPVRRIVPKLYRVYEREGSLSRNSHGRFAAAKYAISCDQANRRGFRFRRLVNQRHLRGLFEPRADAAPRRRWSVVIPFRRSREHLLLSLQSWLQSDLPSTGEIVVVGPISRESLGLSERVRILDTGHVVHGGLARNRGARLAQGEMLFFSDEDHVVPRDVIACHEQVHCELNKPGAVVGNVFGRRGAVLIAPGDRPEHKRRLLEGLRWSPQFAEIAAQVVTGRVAPLPNHDSEIGVWERVGRATFTEVWMRNWADILLQFGENLETYPHRWTRVTGGSVSIPASFFWDIGGFRQDLESLEDWEMGARLQRAGGAIACAPEAEPYHLIHPVENDRHDRDLRSFSILRQAHTELLTNLLNDPTTKTVNPARAILRRFASSLALPPLQLGPLEGPSLDHAPSRSCSITFDDGPHPVGTPIMLQSLRANHAKATFFCLGQTAEKYPDLIRAVAAEGHELGIHGWTHTAVDKMTVEELMLDVRRTRTCLEMLSGKPIRFVRPPYGRATAGFLQVSRDLGLEVVGWQANTEDWLALRPQDIMFNLAWQGVLDKVVLFHDGAGDPSATGAALEWLLTACRRGGCAVVSLGEFTRRSMLPGLPALPATRWAEVDAW
jgi:peptidoglycan/xylan/chitin deacetylase (PgdA/CDA1 family)/glycosyltransferase involved in cell wall biosynthesis